MNKKMNSIIASGATAAIILSGSILPAFAQPIGASVNINASASVNASSSIRGGIGVKVDIVTRAKDRADQEIKRRIDALNKLIVRINDMKRLSTSQKASFASSLQAQITLMNDLQAKITADSNANSTSSLKTDIESIGKAYRIFLLVLPQGTIEAAADRVLSVASDMNTLGAKLQARISAAASSTSTATSTVNIAGAQAALADFNAKVADASAQATAANNAVASLTPDNGDSAKLAANTAALKDARAKLQVAQQDLVTARKDALTIVKNLGIKVSAAVSASANASGSN